MPYELFVRRPDMQSERIMQALLERGVPFVEIQLSDADAAVLEATAGRSLPLVVRGAKVIGGFADLVTHLRRPSGRPRPQPVAC